MKIVFTLLLVVTGFNLSAQWNNTNNQFYDSLHTPVCTASGDQLNTIVLKSYPDSGYFVIWEDHRKGFYDPTQIFAQKYDKTGKQLWSNDGLSVSDGKNSHHFTYSSNNDYRNYSVAATDSAGGFYICYSDDSVSTYVWERLTVQHMRNNGTPVFSGVGSILFTSDQANQQLAPQLIADGNGGFFVSHLHAGYGTMDLYVDCYKDLNGTLQFYGGGLMNKNGTEVNHTSPCGDYTTVEYYQTYVIDYQIYPDWQKGCNVVMTFSQNGGIPNTNNRLQVAFNWLWRVKNDADANGVHFSKDDVRLFYDLQVENGTLVCTDKQTHIDYSYATSKLISNGYKQISEWVYGVERVKGTLLQTDGNINIHAIAVNQRDVNDNTLTDWATRIFYRKQQKFESIPYEYTVAPFKPYSLDSVFLPLPGQDKLGNANGRLTDTLLYNTGATYYYDFSLASGGNKIFAAGIMGNGPRNVLLQQLQVQKIAADSFAVRLKTASQKGVLIGRESSTGFSGTDITYNNPQVVVDAAGNGLFYILESGRSTRVSPVFAGAELAWGAMGKPTGSGHLKGYYKPDRPFIGIDPQNGTGLLCWNDPRVPPSTGNNIYDRHLDKLNAVDYIAPNNLVKKLVNPYGAITANPAVLVGSSKKFTTIDAWSNYSGFDVTTPVVEILDNYNLGKVSISVFENTGTIRKYNGKAYLDRNYTITTENSPGGSNTIQVRLYFTQEEFEALKTAAPSILSPGDLSVIKQPGTGNAPASYSFVAGEETVVPPSWAAVPGGYYIEIAVSSFSNFFIQNAAGALPLQWLNVQAEWINNQAKISWQVAQQMNVKDYTVQQSTDGIHFRNVYNVPASNSNLYSCTVPSTPDALNYYRVQQTDIDGKSTFSKVVVLNSTVATSVSVYPNPAVDKLHLNGPDNYSEFTILNTEGKLLIRGNLAAQSRAIDVQQLPPGNYILKLFRNTEIQTLKFIKR